MCISCVVLEGSSLMAGGPRVFCFFFVFCFFDLQLYFSCLPVGTVNTHCLFSFASLYKHSRAQWGVVQAM